MLYNILAALIVVLFLYSWEHEQRLRESRREEAAERRHQELLALLEAHAYTLASDRKKSVLDLIAHDTNIIARSVYKGDDDSGVRFREFESTDVYRPPR